MSCTAAFDLKAAFNQAADEVEKLRVSAGVISMGPLLGTLCSIKDQGGKGSNIGDALGGIKDFQSTIQGAIKDPTKLQPSGGGCMAAVGAWYGKQVASKLEKVEKEGSAVFVVFEKLGDEVPNLLAGMDTLLSSTMPAIETEIKQLMGLPSELIKVAQTLDDGPKAIADIDLGPLERSLDVSPMTAPLDLVSDFKAMLSPIISELEAATKKLSTFLSAAPNQVKTSFDVATCFPMKSASPDVMTQLLSKLDVLKSIDLQPVLGMLAALKQQLEGLNVDQVRTSAGDFSDKAKQQTAKLVDNIQKAKDAVDAFEKAQKAAEEARLKAEAEAKAAKEAAERAAAKAAEEARLAKEKAEAEAKAAAEAAAKKLQEEKEAAERKAAEAARLAKEKAEAEAKAAAEAAAKKLKEAEEKAEAAAKKLEEEKKAMQNAAEEAEAAADAFKKGDFAAGMQGLSEMKW